MRAAIQRSVRRCQLALVLVSVIVVVFAVAGLVICDFCPAERSDDPPCSESEGLRSTECLQGLISPMFSRGDTLTVTALMRSNGGRGGDLADWVILVRKKEIDNSAQRTTPSKIACIYLGGGGMWIVLLKESISRGNNGNLYYCFVQNTTALGSSEDLMRNCYFQK